MGASRPATTGGRRETKINRKLCGMLGGLDATWENEYGGNRSIDIQVDLPEIRVAVECEKHGNGKRAEAVKDAASRLVPKRLVEVSLAIVYPMGCNTTDDLTPDTMLSYAVVTLTDVRMHGGDHKKHAQDIQWHKVRADGLADVIRKLPQDLGDPDRIAADLKQVLDDGAHRIGDAGRRSLARSIQLESDDAQSASKRALLIVASAALFHARLGGHMDDMRPESHSGEWPPMTLGECINQENVAAALQRAWRLILLVDYKPIFEAALSVLNSTARPDFTGVVHDVAEWASDTAGRVGGLRHDLLGRIFHATLPSAKNDGSYYTSVPAAILLAGLAIMDRSDIPPNLADMKIMDPSCGTGTLLMAAAERVEEVLQGEYDAVTMIENVLVGVDINVTALHMAATTLGLLSPATKFSNMEVRQAPFGLLVKPDSIGNKGLAGSVAAGSLEMYDKGGLDAHFGWTGRGMDNIESGERRSNAEYAHSASLLIMNPPFSRHDLRHKQLGQDGKKLVLRREREIFEEAPAKPNKTSSGPAFLVLAERLTKQNGTIALVLPLVATMNLATASLRPFLSQRFHIDTIVASHDPKRFWFSENTRISEMLVIMRRKRERGNEGTRERGNEGTRERSQPSDTRIINLAMNPGTAAGAASLAREIRSGKDSPNFQTVQWPRGMIEKGDWSGVQFFSPYLVEQFRRMRDGEMFKAVEICKIADVGPNGRTITMYMEQSDAPGKKGWGSIYNNETGRIQSMQARPYTYVVPKPGKIKEAKRFWEQRATLLLPERIQPNITRAAAINSTMPTVGTSWTGARPHIQESWSTKQRDRLLEAWPKAMAVYLNSTPGIIALLGVRIPRKLMYPTYSLEENQRRIPVPDLAHRQISSLASVFDKMSGKTLGLWRDHADKIRTALDDAVCKTLKLNAEDVNRMRYELSREPMVTGRRYNEQPSLTDKYE